MIDSKCNQPKCVGISHPVHKECLMSPDARDRVEDEAHQDQGYSNA